MEQGTKDLIILAINIVSLIAGGILIFGICYIPYLFFKFWCDLWDGKYDD